MQFPVDFEEWLDKWPRAYCFEGFNIVAKETRTEIFNLSPIAFKLTTTHGRSSSIFKLYLTRQTIQFVLYLIWGYIIAFTPFYIARSCGVSEKAATRFVIQTGSRLLLHLALDWRMHFVWSESHIGNKVFFALSILLLGSAFQYIAIEYGI
ncbi:hypothetical protein BofuT4_P032010.1 [Botrytis cinerea T4]|uniref:Uncharacterized protein n=1 Tax=Botryotinia fuckeliana (strain T4) TaxID=999810 RepID=G2Y9P9_BOTF4|nr:hypothetical protein BofuT4_P032010.1 [Botrytis cinerea T4]